MILALEIIFVNNSTLKESRKLTHFPENLHGENTEIKNRTLCCAGPYILHYSGNHHNQYVQIAAGTSAAGSSCELFALFVSSCELSVLFVSSCELTVLFVST